jgi:PhnB protein
MMRINPYLTFKGDCEAAFKFYADCLGGKIAMMMTYGDSPNPEQTPSEWRNKVMHARLVVGDQVLMASDAPPDRYAPMKGVMISISVAEPAEAERIFHALAEKGSVTMPIQQTFWSPRFGMVTDRFGTPWMVNCEPKE